MIVFVLFLGLFSAQAQIPTTEIGTLQFVKDFKSSHVDARPLAIWTPPDYSPLKRYPVIYVYDGQMLFDGTTTWNKTEWDIDSVLGTAISNGALPPCIVVGVYNIPKIRYREYFPNKPFQLLPQSLQDSAITMAMNNIAPSSDEYLKYLVNEVKPYVDSEYMTLTDRENTFIMGASMGGIMSMYALFEYPEVFSAAACLSSHFIGGYEYNETVPNAFAQYIQENSPEPGYCRIYMDYGTETLDAQYEPAQEIIDNQMQLSGWTKEHWETRKFDGASHTEVSWNARLMIPLNFLLKSESP